MKTKQSQKIKPTPTQLNNAMHIACGWQPFKSYYFRTVNGVQQMRGEIPDYCEDRNWLSEIVEGVRASDNPRALDYFQAHLILLTIGYDSVSDRLVDIMTCPMKTVVCAALKATGGWKEEWSEEE
jgi:hypothetical protein